MNHAPALTHAVASACAANFADSSAKSHDDSHADIRADAATFVRASLAALALVLAWDASGLDLPLARQFGSASGFALTHQWWLQTVLHDAAQRLAWVLMAALMLMIWRPFGPLRALPRQDRVGLVASALLAMLAVQLLKHTSLTSCPWELAEFGGRATHVSHWRWGVADGGGGRCFPAGHASTAFSFVAAYFWLQPWRPRLARVWLTVTLVAGLALGGVQMLRGAHYLSHVLWSGWVCWVTGGLLWLAVQALRQRRNVNKPALHSRVTGGRHSQQEQPPAPPPIAP